MNTQDILNFFLIVGIITMTACFVVMTYFIVLALKAVQNLADHLKDTTANFKNGINLKLLSAVPSILVSLIGRIIQKRR